MKNKIAFLLISLLINVNLHASNISVSGDVSGEWNADTVFVTGNITVPFQQTLKITAGCFVLFKGYYSLSVVGEITAIGTSFDNIRFESSDTTGFSQTSETGGWAGIIIQNGHPDLSRFEYCSFRFIKYGGGMCIFLQYGYSEFRYCKFYDNRAPYIMANNFGKHSIQNCVFTNNESSFAIVKFSAGLYDTVCFDNNTIVNNKGPAFYYEGYVQSVCILTNDIFWNNKSNLGTEIVYNSYNSYGFDTSKMILQNCIVQNGAQQPFFNNTCFEKYPRFTDTVNRDFSLRWDNYPANDSTRSIAIDNGYYLYSPDPDSSRSDIGAISYNKVNGPLHTWARFSIDTALGFRNNHRVQFTNLSNDVGVATNWLWEFGDGNTSSEKNPIHTYTKSGKFTVKLLVVDPDGHRDSLLLPNLITVMPGTRINPGDVSGMWLKEYSPYYVYGDIFVPSSNKLELKPGVTVQFMGSYSLDVFGSLIVRGIISDSIKFEAYDTSGMKLSRDMNIDYPFADFQRHKGWVGIHIINSLGSQDSCIMEFSRISDIRSGNPNTTKYSGALKLHRVYKSTVRNSLFTRNFTTPNFFITTVDTAAYSYHNTGINSQYTSATIENCRFENLYMYGPAAIYMVNADSVRISNNSFFGITNMAIAVERIKSIKVLNNTMDSITGICLRLEDGDTSSARAWFHEVNRNVFSNSGKGIYAGQQGMSLAGVSKIRFTNNIFKNNLAQLDVCLNVYGDSIYINNNLFYNNRVNYEISNVGGTCMNILLNKTRTCIVANNTLIDNYGFYPYQSIVLGVDQVKFFNNIIRNKAGTELKALRYSEPAYSLGSSFKSVFTKVVNNNLKGGYPEGGANNFDSSASFLDSLNFDFRLKKTSSSINKGYTDTSNLFLSPTDFFGNQRVDTYSNKIDVGFFEYNSKKPTQIKLSGDSIQENLPPMTFIGKLSTIDPDSGDIHTYSLVNISGVTDNNNDFIIKRDSLYSNRTFYTNQQASIVSIRSKDDIGAYLDSFFTITVKINSVTGLSDPSAIRQFVSVYPNPFSDHLILDSKIFTNVVWSIHSLSGHVLKEGIAQSKTDINLSFLPSGAYILWLSSKGKSYTVKILKK